MSFVNLMPESFQKRETFERFEYIVFGLIVSGRKYSMSVMIGIVVSVTVQYDCNDKHTV